MEEKVAPHIKGDRSELVAQLWLLEQGYEVFKNASHYGPVDLVARKEGKITLVDVKTLQKLSPYKDNTEDDRYYFEHKFYLSEEQLKQGVKPLFVLDKQVGWNRDYFVFKKGK